MAEYHGLPQIESALREWRGPRAAALPVSVLEVPGERDIKHLQFVPSQPE